MFIYNHVFVFLYLCIIILLSLYIYIFSCKYFLICLFISANIRIFAHVKKQKCKKLNI